MNAGRDKAEATASAARQLCALLERPSGDRAAAVRALHRALAALYAAAATMEEGGEAYGDVDLDVAYALTDERLRAVQTGLVQTFGARRYYWLRHDPVFPQGEPGEMVCGDLVDDFLDIFRDVAPALAAWESGADRLDDIAFEWCGAPFRTHWGVHASMALHALHWIVYDHGVGG